MEAAVLIHVLIMDERIHQLEIKDISGNIFVVPIPIAECTINSKAMACLREFLIREKFKCISGSIFHQKSPGDDKNESASILAEGLISILKITNKDVGIIHGFFDASPPHQT